jgi:hypothetical protein
VLAAIAALLAGAAVELPVPQLGGSTLAASVAKHAVSVLDLLNQRSPGVRPTGLLVQLKHKKHVVRHRALPRVRKHKPVPEVPIAVPDLTPPLVDLVTSPLPVTVPGLEAFDVPLITAPPSGPPEFFLPPPGGGFIVPPGGSTPPVVTPPIVTPPTPSVPEPATWAMMLLGFAGIGVALRKQRKLVLE